MNVMNVIKINKLDILFILILLLVLYLFLYQHYKTNKLEFFNNQQDKDTKNDENVENNKDDFDETYAKLYNITFNNDLYIPDSKNIIKNIEKFISKKGNEKIKILDAGCGVGKHYEQLSKDNRFDITGVDKSENMLKYFRLRNPTGKYKNGNIKDVGLFPDNHFDCIICGLDGYYHNCKKDRDLILQNFKRWLKDNSLVCIHLFNRDKIDPRPRKFSQQYRDKEDQKHSLTYFEKFTHDSMFKPVNDQEIRYIEKFIVKNGRKKVKDTKLYIPEDKREVIKQLSDNGFKIVNLEDMKKLGTPDLELCIIQKVLKK